jgi:hypothetical protein
MGAWSLGGGTALMLKYKQIDINIHINKVLQLMKELNDA